MSGEGILYIFRTPKLITYGLGCIHPSLEPLSLGRESEFTCKDTL